MNKSPSCSCLFGGGSKSQIAHGLLAVAAMLCSLPALADRHAEDRHWHGEHRPFFMSTTGVRGAAGDGP